MIALVDSEVLKPRSRPRSERESLDLASCEQTVSRETSEKQGREAASENLEECVANKTILGL